MSESNTRDPSSSSNPGEVVVKHWDWDVLVDFPGKTLRCSVTLHIITLTDGVSNLVLDCIGLEVSEVVSAQSGETLQFEVKKLESALTPSLIVTLPSSCAAKDSQLAVKVTYVTSPDPKQSAAIQWLEPTQTAGKKHPYLYTQCQAIHARSMMPCQDSPSVKTTFSAKVTVPSELVALMSGERLGSIAHSSNSALTVYSFRQTTPIPSYLTALVVGAVKSRSIGPRSHVWCEEEAVEQAAWEFEETEKMLCAAEEVVGEYVWGQYDILVLPPSFPYGGMENPCLTFVSPSLLAGDRSLANVIAHELSHSWTGNLVTNVNWEHFWLNEGFTTYLERRIAGKLFGEKQRHLQALVGWEVLVDNVNSFEKEGKAPYTALVPRLQGVDPDEAFSPIPYEKGSAFLFYLESLLGGPGSLDGFLKAYINMFKYSTLSTEQWKKFFLEFFNKETSEGVFDQVEWDEWINAPGMPPFKPQFDTTLVDASTSLADRWAAVESVESAKGQFSSNDISEMSSGAVQYFLGTLRSKPALSPKILEVMDQCYSFNASKNTEIKFRWLRLCLKAKWSTVYPIVSDLLAKQGRMKFIIPLYRELFGCSEEGKSLALSTFEAHQQFYHSVAAKKISKILKLS